MPSKPTFDVEETLRKAGETFWSSGYEATSMNDLLAAMGIQKGSFYNTYGSKRDAYLSAIEQYASTRFAYFSDQVAGQGPKQALTSLLQIIAGECVSNDGHKGCMIINCALELAHSDTAAQRAVQRSLEIHEQSYADLITAGQAAGEIDTQLDANATAKAMLAIVIGMRVISRAGAASSAIRTLKDQALQLIEP
jgi:TetR/AcrR family transcriptional repressor of nem operon